MDRRLLSDIDEELDSSEAAALCFLCRDVVNRKRLEKITDARGLFERLDEKGLLQNDAFLTQLLRTIRRADLLNLLESDSSQPEETDANPILSDYRVMLYNIYEDTTEENLEKMKYLLSSKLPKRQRETSKTALDLFAEMEKSDHLSCNNLHELHEILKQLDQQLASRVETYMREVNQQHQAPLSPHVSMDQGNNTSLPSIPIYERERRAEEPVPDAQPNTSLPDEYYDLTHRPHGQCVVINNENFNPGTKLNNRAGTQQDEKALHRVFTDLGFDVVIHNNLTAEGIRRELKDLSGRNFLEEDVLVVCVLSHGEKECVFGIDGQKVSLAELTQPFTGARVPTLAGKPKLFFIQACQGDDYQRGSVPCPPRPRQDQENREGRLEDDAGPVYGETVPELADFLLGMATVPECKSFRNTTTGSIYIQELCRQLMMFARSSEKDDILSILTRVNREVSKGEYKNYKQMPEPKYTLTKKLVLKCV